MSQRSRKDPLSGESKLKPILTSPERCAKKFKFNSKRAAKISLKNGNTLHAKLYPYKCDLGNHWHLSSIPSQIARERAIDISSGEIPNPPKGFTPEMNKKLLDDGWTVQGDIAWKDEVHIITTKMDGSNDLTKRRELP